MKHAKKIFQVMIIVFVFFILGTNIVYADGSTITMEGMEGQTSNFISKGQEKAGNLGGIINVITENFVGIGQILTFIGVGVLIAVTTYLGIQYFISPPDKQAELKQKLIALVVSAVVIFGAYNIWKLVLNIVKNFD